MNIALIHSLLRLLLRPNVRRKAIRDLHELDDHLLKDIGIERWEIRAAIDGELNPTRSVNRSSEEYARSVRAERRREAVALVACARQP